MSWTGFNQRQNTTGEQQGSNSNTGGEQSQLPQALPGVNPAAGPSSPTSYAPQNSIFRVPFGHFDPAALISDIPDMELGALSNFNSLSATAPPYRDVPSIIISHLQHPDTYGSQPIWYELLGYFFTTRPIDGQGNLADLYMLLTRVVLPNYVKINRQRMLALYMANPALSTRVRLRFDAWNDSIEAQRDSGPIAVVPSAAYQGTPPRSIYSNRPTPNGRNFFDWLGIPPIPPPGYSVPHQMQPQSSEIYGYLTDEEAGIRSMDPQQLRRRTMRVLSIFWWLARNNVMLEEYEHKEQPWEGIWQEEY